MPSYSHDDLAGFLQAHHAQAGIGELHHTFTRLCAAGEPAADALIDIYTASLPLIEAQLDRDGADAAGLRRLQRIYQTLEQLIAQTGQDGRRNFVIVIPVADRPQHLRACLDSLLGLCRAFGYGGQAQGCYRKLKVIVADDSRHAGNIDLHRALCAEFTALGIDTQHFDQEQQLAQLDRLPPGSTARLRDVLGDTARTAFYHKGPSVLRNIVYLKLDELAADDPRLLFYFIDSDQEFKVNISTPAGDLDVHRINYLYQLDRIFSRTETRILTGKVVGDPPVSPAVMAGTFLDDVIAFLQRIQAESSTTACRFHGAADQPGSGAAYHDMAALFGFTADTQAHAYRCPLHGPHTHADCLADFAARLTQFFDGVHPTRVSYFDPTAAALDIIPARTVYTGNYVLRADALRYFIPFARLRLRMAGPSLGRLLQQKLGERFVSANLPLLHRRTVTASGRSEFRPGVERSAQQVDLSGEFLRQYFGDVMLFTLQKLTALGYPETVVPPHSIASLLSETDTDLQQRYADKHTEILHKIAVLSRLVDDGAGCTHYPDSPPARTALRAFLQNIDANFGARASAYQRIQDNDTRADYLRGMCEALVQYPADRDSWSALLHAAQLTQAET